MRRPLVPALGACLLAASWAAPADDLYSGASTYLDLGRYRMPFRYPDGDHEGHVGEFGVAYDVPLGGDMHGGLQGGYAVLDVADEPQPTAGSLDGRYLGLMLRYEGSEGDYLNMSGEFSYTWHDVNGGVFAAPASEITWYESWLALGPTLRYGRLRLMLGGYYQYVEGSETDRLPARVLDFHAPQRTGAYLGFLVYLDPANSVGLYATEGARRGVRLVFRRDF